MADNLVPPAGLGTSDLGTSTGTGRWRDAYLSGSISDGTNSATPADIRGHIDSTSNPHTVTAAQVGAIATSNTTEVLTDQATVIVDATKYIQRVTITDDRTIANPINSAEGREFTLHIYQDAIGGRTVTWGNLYAFPGKTFPTLSTDPGARDSFGCQIEDDGTVSAYPVNNMGVPS